MMTNRESLKKQASKLPDQPGVYLFLGADKKVLYVGKASSLISRVKSYLSSELVEKRSRLIAQMVEQAQVIDFHLTDSALEAFILEAHLIKKHQPKYNSREKDNKSFNYVIITKEKFPRVLVRRAREIPEEFLDEDIKYLFGPFPQGQLLREALRIIRKLLPFRDKCIPSQNVSGKKTKPCFNAQIGLCPGVCVGAVNQKEYGKTINKLRLFFEGKKRSLLKELEKEMKEMAKAQDFEGAIKRRQTIYALNHIQDVAFIKNDFYNLDKASSKLEKNTRIESYDISHLAGSEVVGVMTVIENGQPKKSDYRKFIIKNNSKIDDVACLGEVLERRLRHDEWPLPDVMVIDGGVAQKNKASAVLKSALLSSGNNDLKKISVVSVVKDKRHKPQKILGNKNKVIKKFEKEILLANAEAHRFALSFHKKRRSNSWL